MKKINMPAAAGIVLLLGVSMGLSGCTKEEGAPQQDQDVEIAVADVPAVVVALIKARQADFTIEEVVQKKRDGRTYLDVEGTLADGSELEFDILMTGDTPEIVEVQRDVGFETLEADLQSMALEANKGQTPVRIIESVQTDQTIVYEFFAEGRPKEPAFEIQVGAGAPKLLDEKWRH